MKVNKKLDKQIKSKIEKVVEDLLQNYSVDKQMELEPYIWSGIRELSDCKLYYVSESEQLMLEEIDKLKFEIIKLKNNIK